MERTTTGGLLLAELRTAAGATQEELARDAGVSVRTVRNIEGGRSTRPHPSTITAITRALALAEAEAQQLLTAFRLPVDQPTWTALMSVDQVGSPEAELSRFYDERANQWTVISSTYLVTVGPDGRTATSHHSVIATPAVTGTRYSCQVIVGTRSSPRHLWRVADTVGCESMGRHLLSDPRLVAFVYDHGPETMKDKPQHYEVSYCMDVKAVSAEPHRPLSDGLLRSVQTDGAALAVDVVFERTPVRVWGLTYRAGEEGPTTTGDVIPDEHGRVQALHQGAAGGVGFGWSWS